MAEKDTVFSSKVKYGEIFNFAEYYKFCYNWLEDEGFGVVEDKYVEKLKEIKKQKGIQFKGIDDLRKRIGNARV